MATVPASSAVGRARPGSFTSPGKLPRSPQPSYAHITDTSAPQRPANVAAVAYAGGLAGAGTSAPGATAKRPMSASNGAPTYFAAVIAACWRAEARTPT